MIDRPYKALQIIKSWLYKEVSQLPLPQNIKSKTLRDAIVERAKLGVTMAVPYVYGGEVDPSETQPAGWDCSEFIQWVYEGLGLKVGDGNQAKHGHFEVLPYAYYLLSPGDVIWKTKDGTIDGITHVGIYLGDGKIANAKGKDYGTVIDSLSAWEKKPLLVGKHKEL